MGIIHVLDEQLTNMIAAGEVVDRPVNIVKECVENALDAGADAVDIEVFQGGIDGVIVTDNGCGMSFDDAKMAFERHATSKIASEEELFSISTMGFRGEALPSIASVARVLLTTANASGGTRIVMEYGDLKVHEKADVPKGTRIEVRGLFLHTPARFKYLKKPNYEFSVIADAVNKIALAHPEVRFTLRHDNRLIFQTAGRSNRLEILYQMFGRDAASQAEVFEASSPDFRISGYAMQPSVNRASKSYIYLCLNGRTIRSWPIVNAVVEGYREFMPKERYPICFLNIETDFQLVDVNVHPNKLEVRISKEEYLADLIKRTIASLFEEKIQAPEIQPASSRRARPDPNTYTMEPMADTMVIQENLPPSYGSRKQENQKKPDFPAGYSTFSSKSENQISRSEQSGKSHTYGHSSYGRPSDSIRSRSAGSDSSDQLTFLNGKFLSQANQAISALSQTEEENQNRNQPGQNRLAPDRQAQSSVLPQPAPSASKPSAAPLASQQQAPNYPAGVTPREPDGPRGTDYLDTLRIIGQLKDSYIVCEDDEGLVLIDQHAAQERANFERILADFEKPVQTMQPLMLPISRNVPPATLALLDVLNEKVAPYGLHFEALASSLVIREIPAWMMQLNAERFLDDLLSWFVSHQDVNMQELRRHMIATCACHSSIRFNHALSLDEMKKVIADLKTCRQPYHCPHGRPTIVRLSLKQLAREFERA